jgi:hypothetical protein
MVGQTQEDTHSAQARLLHANAAKPLASTGYWRTRFVSLPVFFPTNFVRAKLSTDRTSYYCMYHAILALLHEIPS